MYPNSGVNLAASQSDCYNKQLSAAELQSNCFFASNDYINAWAGQTGHSLYIYPLISLSLFDCSRFRMGCRSSCLRPKRLCIRGSRPHHSSSREGQTDKVRPFSRRRGCRCRRRRRHHRFLPSFYAFCFKWPPSLFPDHKFRACHLPELQSSQLTIFSG